MAKRVGGPPVKPISSNHPNPVSNQGMDWDVDWFGGNKDNNFAQATAAKKRKRFHDMDRFLDALRRVDTVEEACREIGISRNCYNNWRRKTWEGSDEFKAKVKEILDAKKSRKVDEKGHKEVDYDGSFVSFRKAFLGMDTYWHQLKVINAIENAQPNRITQVLMPPEHGKTTILTDFINYKLATKPNTRITYVHEDGQFSRKVVGQVQSRMLENQKYINRFGPFQCEGKPWRANYFTVCHADHDERDYSLEGRGITSRVQGVRTDFLIVDDIQSLDTLSQSNKYVDRLRQDFFSRPGRHGIILQVGTRVGPGDVWETMWADDGLWDLIDLIELPAVDQDGEPLCPELWPKSALDAKRKLVGEEAWWRNFQQAPLSSGMQTFTPDIVNACKRKDTIVQEVVPRAMQITGCDPALGGGNVVLHASATPDYLKVVDVQIDYNLARNEDIISRIGHFAARYGTQHLVIERDSMQKGLARSDNLKETGKKYGFHIHEHSSRGEKADPITGVAEMSLSFTREHIILPWGDAKSEHRLKELVAQLLAWRPDVPTKHLTQDAVMALWFVWKFWMERKPTEDNNLDKFKFGGMPSLTVVNSSDRMSKWRKRRTELT